MVYTVVHPLVVPRCEVAVYSCAALLACPPYRRSGTRMDSQTACRMPQRQVPKLEAHFHGGLNGGAVLCARSNGVRGDENANDLRRNFASLNQTARSFHRIHADEIDIYQALRHQQP
jgi:hypothetical protein